MKVSCCFRYWMICLALAWTGLLITGTPASAQSPKVVRVSMVKSIFRDIPDPIVKALMIPFGSLMYQQTGLNGQLQTSGDALELGEQLESGKVHLGVFHGFEFAWAQEKYPNLKPLMIAINKHRYLSVHLITSKGNPVTRFEDLQGKTISLPQRSREHCYLFLERHCEKLNCTPEEFFGKIVKHNNVEDGLDDVVRGEVEAVITDGLSLECYNIVKPGCMNRLKTVEKSAVFPAAVVAYRDGSLDQDSLNRFRKGMLNANKNPKSRGLMTLWKLTAFESVPADYQQVLENIRKAYPAPSTFVLKTPESNMAESQ